MRGIWISHSELGTAARTAGTDGGDTVQTSRAASSRRVGPYAGLDLADAPSMATEWIRRFGSKRSGFRYVNADDRVIRDQRQLARIDALRVPPAWRDVHIAASPRSAIQAWGFDARGRKQYRYNDRAVERRELRKYHR